jgi:hypothetical protein
MMDVYEIQPSLVASRETSAEVEAAERPATVINSIKLSLGRTQPELSRIDISGGHT